MLGSLSVQLVSKISNLAYVVLVHQRHRHRDGRTDGQTDTTCNRNTALCTIRLCMHPVVKTLLLGVLRYGQCLHAAAVRLARTVVQTLVLLIVGMSGLIGQGSISKQECNIPL